MPSKQVQVRLSAYLLDQLDKLCEKGVFKTRSEAISDAVRHLLESSAFTNEMGMLTSKYLSKSLEKSRRFEDFTVLTEEEWAETEKALNASFGTSNTDQILRKLRGGI